MLYRRTMNTNNLIGQYFLLKKNTLKRMTHKEFSKCNKPHIVLNEVGWLYIDGRDGYNEDNSPKTMILLTGSKKLVILRHNKMNVL